ncbi:MAG: hypothetical protein OXI83_09365 [Gemmatimonadota bacterium]|nr:hypothetical protein [Gemmatimonadota bacterium]
MDNLALLWIMGTFLYVFHPRPTEIGVYGGPTWPENTNRDHPAILMTAGATAYVPVSRRFGIRYGLAYKQGSYSAWCRRNWDEWPGAGPCVARMRDQIDHVDFSMIAEMQIASLDDELDLRFMFGPTWGIPVRCRVKNLTHDTEEACRTTQEDARLIAGGGLAVRATERVSVTMEFRYGINLRELDDFRAEDSNGLGVAPTLIAGVNFHLNR